MSGDSHPAGGGGDDAYRAQVAHLAGEPLLGPRQAGLVDALIHRLATGSPMSPQDYVVADFLARTLGIAAHVPTRSSDDDQPEKAPSEADEDGEDEAP